MAAANVPPPPPRKKKGHGGHHGGSWKVALADFMTSMFALFLVLWLTAIASQSEKAAIAGYFRDPGAFKPGSIKPLDLGGSPPPEFTPSPWPTPPSSSGLGGGGQGDGKKELGEVGEALGSDPALSDLEGQFKVQMTPDGLEIQMSDSQGVAYFDSGAASMSAQGLQIVERVASALRTTDHEVVIAGHTDAQPFASGSGDNWQLSAARANAVRNALQAAGVEEGRMAGVIGYGASKPLLPADPKAPENRRVAILVRPAAKAQKLNDQGLPDLPELKLEPPTP